VTVWGGLAAVPGGIPPGGGLSGGPAAVPRALSPLRGPQGQHTDEVGGLGAGVEEWGGGWGVGGEARARGAYPR